MSTAEWTPDGPPILSLRGIHKAYGGVVAIEKFDLDVNAGEVVALGRVDEFDQAKAGGEADD